MSEKTPVSHQYTAPVNSGSRLVVALLVILTSAGSAYIAVLAGAFTVNKVAFDLSILTSLVCFALAMALVYNRKYGFAILLSLGIAPIYFGLAILYFETYSFQIKAEEKMADISRLIVDRVKSPQPSLERAIREGSIRRATAEDVIAFRDAYIANKYTSKNLPVPDTEDALSVTKVDTSKAYVVLKKFHYPSGMENEYRVVFFVPKGVPEPSGDIGHSAFYDFATLTVRCTMARTGEFSC